jgi:hypothetical protein
MILGGSDEKGRRATKSADDLSGDGGPSLVIVEDGTLAVV